MIGILPIVYAKRFRVFLSSFFSLHEFLLFNWLCMFVHPQFLLLCYLWMFSSIFRWLNSTSLWSPTKNKNNVIHIINFSTILSHLHIFFEGGTVPLYNSLSYSDENYCSNPYVLLSQHVVSNSPTNSRNLALVAVEGIIPTLPWPGRGICLQLVTTQTISHWNDP